MWYILTHHNFEQLKDKRNIIYKDVPEEYIEYFKEKNANIVYSNIKFKNSILLPGDDRKIIQLQNDNAEIIHFIGDCPNKVNFRRHKLNKYLKTKYIVQTVTNKNIKMMELSSNAKAIIISFPMVFDDVRNKIFYFAEKNNIPIYYDRTDNWEEYAKDIEIIKRAKFVTCSSRYIYDCTKHNNKAMIINAADKYDIFNNFPKKEKIAVFSTNAFLNKLNKEKIQQLIKEHNDYRFIYIGRKIRDVSLLGMEYLPFMSKLKLLEFLKKCKIGILTLQDTEYFKGQFNLKVWDFIQARMPVITDNTYNYDGILKNVHTEWTEEFVDEPITYWKETFDKILECYELS